jgi:capsular exopolysaccharide synthesis family protein
VETQQLSELNSQLVVARANRAEAEARLRRIRELVGSGAIDSAPDVLASPLIQQLREQEVELQRGLAEASGRLGNRHPTIINSKNELRDLRAKINAEVGKVVQSVASEVEVAQSREAELTSSLEALQTKAADLSRAEVKLKELQREADANHALFYVFLNRFKQTSTESDNQQPDARIISAAAVPSKPSYPKFARTMILSAFGAVALGVLLITLIERLDKGFRSADQLEQVTGMPHLALVPTLTRRQLRGLKPNQYAVENASSCFAEAIQAIRTGIHFSNVDRRPKVVLISSSLPGEGKTTIALALGQLAASGGQRVMLIDGDLRRPNLGQILNFDSSKGLQELLAGDANFSETLVAEKKTGLLIIPSSPSKSGSQDLLNSQRMRQLLAQARASTDLIIIDSPPLMAVTDALLLADLADCVLFLVRWRTTPRHTVLTALKHLKRSPAHLAGIVMTQVDLTRYSKFGYGDVGYYYARHGEYYKS